jgi:beta-lactamase regulating signal transducer with metallopeptidase domain
VETDVPLALTVGLRDPEIIVSSSLLASIDESHIEAIVAHEKAHAARRDNVTKLVARALTILWWPRARASVLEDLGLACEEACDERAAEVVGDRLLVAEAILAVRRISAGSTDVLASAFGQDATAARVRSLIAEERGRPLRLGRAVLVLAVVLVVTLGMSDPLHDAVETLVSLAT